MTSKVNHSKANESRERDFAHVRTERARASLFVAISLSICLANNLTVIRTRRALEAENARLRMAGSRPRDLLIGDSAGLRDSGGGSAAVVGWPSIGMGIRSIVACIRGRTCCNPPTTTHSSALRPFSITRRPSSWSGPNVTRRSSTLFSAPTT